MYQFDAEGNEYTIAYVSRSVKGAEANYTITELEGLALVWALKKWRILLMGRRVRVNTDHRALQFLSSCTQTSQRIARWLNFLQEFELDIRHIPGTRNKIADTLSRYPKDDAGKLAKHRQRVARICVLQLRANDGEDTSGWAAEIHQAQDNHVILQQQRQQKPEDYFEHRGLLRRRSGNIDRVCVPELVAWRLIPLIHAFILHFGTDKVIGFAKRYFDIRNVDRIARDVVASCYVCIASKIYTRPTRGPEYYDLPNDIGEIISIDLYGPLPRSGRGRSYIIVVMDQFSKFVKLFAVSNQKLETIVDVMENRYFAEVGKPQTILIDCAGQFVTR